VLAHPARIALLLIATLSLLGCSRSKAARHPDGYEVLSLRYEGNPGVVTVPELAADLGYLAPLELDYVGDNLTGGPHSIQAVATGDVDFGTSFNGAIVKLIASKAPLQAVVASYGTDGRNFQGSYVLEGSPIKSARDFVGKKVAMNTLGAHAEFALREYLRRGGLTSQESSQVSMIALPAANCELALREKQLDVAVLGTIHRDKALARGGLRRITSDYELFGGFNAGSIVMTKRFLAANPNTARKFVEGVGRAIDWAHSTPREQVIARFEQIIGRRGRNENTSIVKHWEGTGVVSPRGMLRDRDFQMWIAWLTKDGQLAPGAFAPRDAYTNEFQPAVAHR